MKDSTPPDVVAMSTHFYMLLDDAEAQDLAAGCVPLAVQAMARTMLEWRDCDRRNAAKPTRLAKKTRAMTGTEDV